MKSVGAPYCAVNGKPIRTFFTDKEVFKREGDGCARRTLAHLPLFGSPSLPTSHLLVEAAVNLKIKVFF